MKSKFAFSVILSMAALTGGALTAALPSQACIFSDQSNTSTGITGDGAGSSGSTNFSSRFGVAGLAALGFVASGLFLKAQLSRRSELAPELAPGATPEPAAAPKAASVFPIEVPAAALADHDEIAAGIR